MRLGMSLSAALLALLVGTEAAAFTPRCPCTRTEAPQGAAGTLRFGAGALKPALSIQAGAYYLAERWQVGAEAELNPFFAIETPDMVLGSFNLGGYAGYRLRLTDGFTLRFQAGLGIGVLLFDAYGFDAGTPGVYANVRLLGIDLDFGRRVLLGIDLADLSAVVFGPLDMPFIYPQWRVSISITMVGRRRSRATAGEPLPAAQQPAALSGQ